jgi:thymidylate synthase
MYFRAATLDDLLRRVLQRLVRSGRQVAASRGDNREICGTMLRLTNPRARLSHTEGKGKVFSGLGELFWYLSKSDRLSFIEYYIAAYVDDSEDGQTIFGAYGPRIFDMRGNDQFRNVLDLLRHKPHSRRAVIQLFNAEDIAKERKEIPCTSTLQFLIRDGKLDLIVTMRSNDAYLGLSHDVFCFTMVQELVARSLHVELGTYTHFVGSLHLYDRNIAKARSYLKEGWQPTLEAAMPPMPEGEQMGSLDAVLKAEASIRNGRAVDIGSLELDDYWSDIVRLLQVYRFYVDHNRTAISAVKRDLVFPLYRTFVTKLQASRSKR